MIDIKQLSIQINSNRDAKPRQTSEKKGQSARIGPRFTPKRLQDARVYSPSLTRLAGLVVKAAAEVARRAAIASFMMNIIYVGICNL